MRPIYTPVQMTAHILQAIHVFPSQSNTEYLVTHQYFCTHRCTLVLCIYINIPIFRRTFSPCYFWVRRTSKRNCQKKDDNFRRFDRYTYIVLVLTLSLRPLVNLVSFFELGRQHIQFVYLRQPTIRQHYAYTSEYTISTQGCKKLIFNIP